jgi:hypothetical protein
VSVVNVLCVLSGRGFCDGLIATDCGASLCVISEPPEQGGSNS